MTKVYEMQKPNDSLTDCVTVISTLVESKQWVIVPLPATYMSTNWPIRVCFLLQKENFFHKFNNFIIYLC